MCTDQEYSMPAHGSAKRSGFLLLVAISLLLVLMCGVAFAQVTSGTIFGTVKDSSGALVPGATVVVKSDVTGILRTTQTKDEGTFVVPNIAPGTYSITVEAKGFRKVEKTGIQLSAGDRLSAGEFTLAVGAAENTVTVAADAGQIQLQSNSGERSDLVTGKQINDLALNGRNIIDFVKVVPGVVSSFNGEVSGTGGIDAFNVNGTRANQHEFTIDGSSNVDTGNNGGTHVTINPDAIAELKILTSNYQAEYGKAGGGQLAVVTKSGTNTFHGNARYFHRHEGLNANSWFNKQSQLSDTSNPHNDPPLYRYNYFGYQIGGPVVIPGTSLNKNRDKLYFFWSQEFYRQLIPGGFDQFRVPTELERSGDFSQSVDGNGNPLVIYNPATGLPFPGNRIDRNALTPQQQAVFDEVSKILNLYSLPNVQDNHANFASQLSYDNPRREDVVRVDYQLTNNHRIYGRYIHNITEFESPMQTWNLSCMGRLQYPGGCLAKNPSWNLAVNLVSTISPTLVNEFSFGPSVTRSSWEGNNGNTTLAANGINLPLLFPVTSDTNVPDFSFGGNENIDYPWSYLGANPWFQANTTINLNDNITKVINQHTFKVGVFFQRARKDQIAWGNSNGQVNFRNCATSVDAGACPNSSGSPYASALLGYFDSVGQSSSRPIGYFRYTNLEFYAQDTWKLTPRLTLDFGMRFAWYQPQYDAQNQLAIFDPASYDPARAVRLYRPAPGGGAFDPANPGTIWDGSLVGSIVPNSGDPLNGIHFASDGYFRGGWDDRGIMPEPRFGFAYALTDDSKTILRGGYGMMHDRIQGNLIFNPVFSNPRNVTTPTVRNGNLSNLAAATPDLTYPLSGILGADPSGNVPTIHNFSLGIQRDLGWGTTIDVSYVGSLSRHLVTARDANAILYGTTFTQAAQDPSKYPGGVVPATQAGLPTQYSDAGLNFNGANALDPQFLVPFQGYNNISFYKFDGTSNYNSLQVSAQRRFSQGLTFGVAYTWSKSLTTANSDEDAQDPFNPAVLDYRAASWDRTHVLVFNYVYDLPKFAKKFGGPKWLSYITDNYQLSGITSFQSGAPLDTSVWIPANIYTGSNMWGSVAPYFLAAGSGVNDNVGSSTFDPATFQTIIPVGGKFVGRGTSLRGGGLNTWDMSLFKNIPLGNEQRYLQLRLEAFNVFNHPNFERVNLNWSVSDPSGATPATIQLNTRESGCTGLPGSCFGEYSSTYTGSGGPRVIQLGAKFYF
jgi:Carboxypeptidase regulatory-like domain/TonB-dependent Receptor Plug Domain